MSTVPIAPHPLLSDCHSAALVTADGSVDWLCFPRFDSPSIFGRLLDDAAGHWSIRPAGAYTASRRYLDRTLVLETSFRTQGGTVLVTDALATGAGSRGHALGRGAPHLLIRSVACVGGPVEVEMSYAPRPEYGLLRPLLSQADGGVTARGGAEWLVLSSPVSLTTQRSTATARIPMAAGETLVFALQRSTLEEHSGRVLRGLMFLGSLVEVDELVVRPFRPAARRLVDLGREDGNGSRHGKGRGVQDPDGILPAGTSTRNRWIPFPDEAALAGVLVAKQPRRWSSPWCRETAGGCTTSVPP
jgi:hypothetical protein